MQLYHVTATIANLIHADHRCANDIRIEIALCSGSWGYFGCIRAYTPLASTSHFVPLTVGSRNADRLHHITTQRNSNRSGVTLPVDLSEKDD